MKRAPLGFVSLVAGIWLTTLGACGRTSPLLEDTYGAGTFSSVGGDDSNSGGTSGTVGGSGNVTSVGGSNSGGTGANGGSGNRANGGTGGVTLTGGTGGGGTGGDISPFGGTGDRGAGGTFARGGSRATGGTGGGIGGRPATGGTAGLATGGTGADGGTGAVGGVSMGGASGFPNITCDGATCDPATSVCCKRRGSMSTCEDVATGCSSGATLSCSGGGQCAPGQVCCFHFNSSSCADSCDVGVGSPGNPPTVILCDSDDDCAAGELCVIAPRGIAYCATAQ